MTKFRLTLLIGCGVLGVGVLGLLGFWLALQYEPKFYREALNADPDKQEKASDDMLRCLATLFSDVRKPGKWRGQFTADEVNGWLAVDLVKNHPHALPPHCSDPRVTIESDKIVFACRYEYGILDTILTLTVKTYMADKNSLALEIVSARAGVLPMPLGRIIEGISTAARQTDMRLEWRQSGGDPVALISIAPPDNGDDRLEKLETMRIEKGEFIITGNTEQEKTK